MMKQHLRTFQILFMVGIFCTGLWGCGQKHLNVSTSSGKGNEQEGQETLEAGQSDAQSDQMGFQNASMDESGLGSQTKSFRSTGQDPSMALPIPIIRNADPSDQGNDATQPLEASETGSPMDTATNADGTDGSGSALAMAPTDSNDGAQDPMNSPNAADSNSPSDLSNSPGDLSNSQEAPPLVAHSGSDDQASESVGSSLEDEFDSLALGTENQGDAMDSPHVERVPENIAVAKAEPSGDIEDQLARIKEEELATISAGLQDIYFEFDSWRITEDGKEVLEKSADWLEKESAQRLLIEGHCDQRGTQAYNIVLGKKRAIAIRDYLVHLGIDPSRLSIITYGKEKPFCTASTEDCYQENRRGHLLVQKP